MDVGGAETFLMKIYRVLDRNKYQMDFCVAKGKKGFYEEEIKDLDGKIYRITPKTKSIFKNFADIRKIVRDNNYKNVIRISQNSLSAIELLAARMGGANNIIFRSSNSSTCGGKKDEFLHRVFRPFANLISNKKIAPSKEAGDFMFGRSKYIIINNGVPIEKYHFSQKKRSKYRNELGISDDTIVLGHVGRFEEQKNHKFLIELFKKYHKIKPNSVLLLIGGGKLGEKIKQRIMENKLMDSVKLLGIRSDISELYSAMDCYIFPSLYEGMPNTVIEAQVSGLPCLVSDKITKDCKITENVKFLPLDNPDQWIDSLACLNNMNRIAEIDEKYDIKSVVKDFVKVVYA